MEDLRILYCDDALLAIDKPAGLLSVPGRGPDKADCAIARAQTRWPDALVVHRLDMGTSGILVFGRGPAAQRALSMAFEQRRCDKRYEALVAGLPESDAGEVELPLRCDWPRRPRQMVDVQQGRPALTHWQVLGRDASLGRSRLALTPITGRSHQLRVHLAAIGHPILGDELYAPPAHHAAAPRLWLHACRLALPHPVSGETIVVASPAPF
ncbi:RluA family pseudouridine synthase [Ideonella sp. 4Y11]|uniref:Dual-specificity RNA pseudouridine synthase RluA n=1 Tax=Ideonella aquatica TaxID=2824119 RepID=A0A941BJG6_9BURK|nr:RluA family pseudouridine synthase [Ideonella aquatica]MBQ0957449.1 RluA family pseudouridine synthase [Ideonella aquatica]